ncbi:TniQ family protein [Streptomyces nondiastaticus]|uniref:TniQ family protein n=1 Tax=Streptomyces nondiastaticus TaxID=3154512 RepID=UPI00343AA6A6
MEHRGLPRRLPAVPLPEDGESFVSWLARAAADWQIAPGHAVQALGLDCHPGYSVVRPKFFGIALTPRSLERAAAATGLQPDRLRAMQLTRYDKTALDLNGLDLASESSITALARREWALFTSSRACPQCLALRPVWPLWWRLGIAAVCPLHYVLLVDVCRRCHDRLGRGNTGHPRGLLTRHQDADLARCNNRRRAGERRKAGLCEQELAALPITPVPAALANLQQRVLAVANGLPGRVAGQEATPADFFAALRFAVGLARLASTDQDLADCPALPREAAEEFAADQHDRRNAHQGGAGAVLQTNPPSAGHAAAVLVLADRVLSAAGEQACQEVLAPWLERAAELRRSSRTTHDPLRRIPRPACLESAVRAAAPRAFRITGALTATAPASPRRLTPDHLPRVVAAPDYADLIAQHLPGTTVASGRRFTALALARLAGAPTWQQAAADLARNPHKAAHVASVLVSRIPDPDAFWQAIEQLGARTEQRGPINYGARRRMLASLTSVPGALLLDPRRPLKHLATMQRRRHAAAWTWEYLTCDDIREAPAYTPELWPMTNAESVREGRRVFALWIPAPVAEALTAFGHTLINAKGGT